MLDLRPEFAAFTRAFGLSATVLRPNTDSPVTCALIWGSEVEEAQPFGSQLRRVSPRREASIALSGTLVDIPMGSIVRAPLALGSAVRVWRVDGLAAPATAEVAKVFLSPV